jgi:HlyD family secretion protein
VVAAPTAAPAWARDAVAAAAGPISATVTADGTLTAELQSRVAFRSNGRLKGVLVSPGDAVAAGQVLATLDPAELELAVAQAQANLGLSQAKLEAARAAARSEDVQGAKATLEAVQGQMRQSEGADEQADALLTEANAALEAARGGLPSLDRAVRAEDEAAAERSVRDARTKLAALLAGAARTPAAQAPLAQAQALLGKAQGDLGPEPAGPGAPDVAVAQAQVDVAQAQLDQARASLDGSTLVAPFSATVGEVLAGPGESVNAGAAVVTLLDRRRLRAEVLLDEVDVTRVRPGQPVTMTFEAAPGRPARGGVGAVSPLPSVRAGLVRYAAQIAIEETPETDLRPGMAVRAQIVTATREQTLLVPSRAVHFSSRGAAGAARGAAAGAAPGTAPGEVGGDETVVYVVGPDGRASRRAVTTGLTSGQVTEVVEGLAEGERVVVPPAPSG